MIAWNGDAQREEELWSAFASGRDSQLREKLIERYTPLALAAVRQLLGRYDEDLEQVALLGLIKAVDRFDPTTGCHFSTFAVPTIQGELKRCLRDQSRLVRCPRTLLNLRAAAKTKVRELAVSTGRTPSPAEVAAALGVKLDEVVEVMALEEICHPVSLEGLARSRGGDQPRPLEERLGVQDPELERAEERIAWSQVLGGLNPRLRQVIELRYYQHLSQREAGQRLGMSQMQVSRLEHRALDRLRSRLVAA